MKIAIVSGPSGVGKNTILSELFKTNPKFERIITTTTREKRSHEVAGSDYYFISKEKFETNIKENKMIEHALVHRNLYGSTYDELERIVTSGNTPIYEVDPQGAKHLSDVLTKFYENCEIVTVFLLPPNNEELKRRLAYRGTDTKEEMEKRYQESLKQMEEQDNYDYTVINDDVAKTTATLDVIINGW